MIFFFWVEASIVMVSGTVGQGTVGQELLVGTIGTRGCLVEFRMDTCRFLPSPRKIHDCLRGFRHRTSTTDLRFKNS